MCIRDRCSRDVGLVVAIRIDTESSIGGALVGHGYHTRLPCWRFIYWKAPLTAYPPPAVRAACLALRVPFPTCEFRFHPERRWRFDYAWPDDRIALEQEGGIWVRGRHTRGKGFMNDLAKYNCATALGWRIFRVTPNSLLTEGLGYVKELRDHERERH